MAQDKYGGNITFSLDEKKDHMVTFHPRVMKRIYHFSRKEQKVAVTVRLKMEGDVIESTFPADFSKQSTVRKLQDRVAKEYEKRAQKMIEKVQKKYKSDVLGFGRQLKAFHYDIWKDIDWDKDFSEAQINVVYDVKLRRTGMEMR